MYKYNCRKCPIRNTCIDQSSNADSIRLMIRRAFDAKTDTLATWGRLQQNCLLIKAEEEEESKSPSLSARLAKSRAEKSQVEAANPTEEQPPALARPKPILTPPVAPPAEEKPPLRRLHSVQEPPQPDYLQPVEAKKRIPSRPLRKLTTSALHPAGLDPQVMPHWLIIERSNRHITLPTEGSLVFGRFDPNVGIPPDIDLKFEDKSAHMVSRRHASVHAANGKHTVEDLGSSTGVFLNGSKIAPGPSRPLEPGDALRLGGVILIYDKIPAPILKKARTEEVKHVLYVTPTGRRIEITPATQLIIGRADRRVGFVPNIDLSNEGEAARLVSRRHALIQWRYGQPYLEDLGSSFGTRIHGELLALGQSTPLLPGDHIWLAGCVLAYDIEL
jgi:pSer/pThr/pTyr-binding forkhead associated (FHA) protein